MKFSYINKFAVATSAPYAEIFNLVKDAIKHKKGKIISDVMATGLIEGRAPYLLSKYDIIVKFQTLSDNSIRIDFNCNFPGTLDIFKSGEKKCVELIEGVVRGEWITPSMPPSAVPESISAPRSAPNTRPTSSASAAPALTAPHEDIQPSPFVVPEAISAMPPAPSAQLTSSASESPPSADQQPSPADENLLKKGGVMPKEKALFFGGILVLFFFLKHWSSSTGIAVMLLGGLSVLFAWLWAFLLAFANKNIEAQIPYAKLFMSYTGGIYYPVFLLQGLEVAGTAGDVRLRNALFNNLKFMLVGWCAIIVGAVLLNME